MKEFKYKYSNLKFLIFPIIVILIIFCALCAQAMVKHTGNLSMYAILLLALVPLYFIKVLFKILYQLIYDAPQVIIFEGSLMITKFMWIKKQFDIKLVKSISTVSQFYNDNVFNIKISFKNLSDNMVLMPYHMEVKEILKNIIAINPECVVEHSLLNDISEANLNSKCKYIYSWDYNIQYSIIILMPALFVTFSMVYALLITSNIMWLILLAAVGYATFKFAVSRLLFFINKPHEIELFEDKLVAHIGINTRHEIPIKDVETIFYAKGFYNLFCIKSKERSIYFSPDLIGYKTMIAILKHKNPKIEIDHKSIFEAEEKERKRNR